MVEIIRSHSLAYFPVRKVGTTTMRAALREIAENEADYVRTWDIPMSPYIRYRAKGCRKIAIVRDPVRRFLSAFGDRVVAKKDMDKGFWDRALLAPFGLSARPDIDTFCRHYRAYYLLNDKIRRHFRPQWPYLGRDLSYFDKIYRLESLGELTSDISELAGRKIVLPKLHTTGPKYRYDALDPEIQQLVLGFTAADYAFLKGFYTPPDAY